jgi:exodeoxyribonuclease III
MKITTWNINGIRAATKKGVFNWIGENNADIVCFQEIKAKEEQINFEPIQALGYKWTCNPAERPGYSGVTNLYLEKSTPHQKVLGFGNSKFDLEGRIIHYSYPKFELFNIYFPNGGQENKRVPFKLEFYSHLLKICDSLIKEGKEIVITGDFNTAHNEIDLKNPKENRKNTGFLPEEREWIDKFIDFGFSDAFRILYPEKEEYSWWTYRYGARSRNIGWRLDYFLVTGKIMKKTKDVIIHGDVLGSDHCPVSIIFDI